jgi:hypothetical protein
MNTTFVQYNFTCWIEVAYYGKHFANREDIVIAVWHKVVEISTSRWCQWCSLPLPSLIMNHKQGQGLICMLLTEHTSSFSCALCSLFTFYTIMKQQSRFKTCGLLAACQWLLYICHHLMVKLTGTWYLLSNICAPLSVLPHCCQKK